MRLKALQGVSCSVDACGKRFPRLSLSTDVPLSARVVCTKDLQSCFTTDVLNDVPGGLTFPPAPANVPGECAGRVSHTGSRTCCGNDGRMRGKGFARCSTWLKRRKQQRGNGFPHSPADNPPGVTRRGPVSFRTHIVFPCVSMLAHRVVAAGVPVCIPYTVLPVQR